MSWSANTPESVEKSEDITPEAFITSPGDLPEGSRSQYETAVEAAKHLADAVDGPHKVTATGHSNADQDTGAAEHASITITQVKTPPAAGN